MEGTALSMDADRFAPAPCDPSINGARNQPGLILRPASGLDDCGFGWHVMDVATSLMFLLGEPHYDVALAGFVEGYRSVRPFPDAHLEMLPVFFLTRAMSYVGWAGSRPEAPITQEMGPWLVESTLAMAEQFLAQAT